MGCPSCGAEYKPAAKFCEECGARLARRCPQCGHEVGTTAKFCLECGQQLAVASAAPTAPPPSPTYTPRHLAEKILASRAGLEGERKQVTVLFADVVGSTELIRDLDPEDAQRLLDGAVTRMMDAVHRYEGTVSRAMGDGIMALFGAPLAHEDHAVRACYAALAMHEAVRRYAEEARRTYGVVLQVRVGLNSGEVVVRLISDDLHMDYTALGQTVHLASRMEQLAKPETTSLTPDTVSLVEGYVQVRSLGLTAVKGLAEPMVAYELVGAGGARTRLQAAAARGLTRFVGRDAEVEALRAALERAGGGRGQLASAVGEPGVGKSRLVWELTHSHRTEGWLVLEASSVSYGKATSYLPVIDLLKGYCRIEPRDDPRTVREKVAGKVLMLDESLRSTLPALLSLLDVEGGDPAWSALDPPQRRRQTLDAVKRLLLRESREQPLLLVFEDLHWVDAESQALLDSLVESLPTARMLLLVNYRPEYRHIWGNKGYYTQLRLDPLPPASAGELLGSLLGDDPSLAPLTSLFVEQTEGNPLFLEESVRSLVEQGALVGERGAYRLAQPVGQLRMPATVQAILAGRIDRLAPEEKRLLQTAAVVGKDVPLALLQAVADLPEDDLRRGLASLREAEFLYEAALFPEPEYTFKHALTHEVAYGSLLQDRRKALHGRIVDLIERLYPDRLDEQVELLAEHAFRGERWEAAVTYLRQAGAKAAGLAAYREAVAALERALVALGHRPDDPERQRAAIDLRLRLRNALAPLGESARVLEHLGAAERLAEAIGDRRRLGLVSHSLCASLYWAGELDRAIEAGRRAQAIGAELGDFDLLVAARAQLGTALHFRGDFVAAIAVLRENLAALGGEHEGGQSGMAGLPSVLSRSALATALASLGQLDEAAGLADEGVRIAEAAGHRYSLALALLLAGRVESLGGNLSEADRRLGRCLELGRTWEFGPLVAGASYQLGRAMVTVGRVAEGRRLLEQALEQFDKRSSRFHLPDTLAWLARAHALEGRVADGLALAQQAVRMAGDQGQRADLAECVRVLAEIQAGSDVEAAQPSYREALALAEELGMRPLQAHCHLGLGRLLRRLGRLDEARGELSTAVAMLREMGMTFWLPEAEAELTQVAGAPVVGLLLSPEP